jgi:hypothetical protein
MAGTSDLVERITGRHPGRVAALGGPEQAGEESLVIRHRPAVAHARQL